VSTVLLSGASGFIGSHLAKALAADGHRIVPLVRRRPSSAHTVSWDPEAGTLDRDALARVQSDVVINLAGEPIAHRWTASRKRRIRESRIRGTAALAQAIAMLPSRPRVLLSGSAMGYYGAHRGDELLDEESTPGSDFLAQTARDWEAATASASSAGIRVVLLRTGLVLQRGGGVLARMLPPFRLGLGGRLGGGKQWMSWIAMEDVVRAIRFVAETTISGPVNLVAPAPVTNSEFTKVLARVLHRPAILPVPRLLLQLLFGTMAENTILASQRLVPKRLAGAGFEFRHPLLEETLRFELRR
jgi:uncharacterized protein (TIGR01777 family)